MQVAHPLAPENLRAIDFGLSKFLRPGQTCHSCVGSSYYVAPEVLKVGGGGVGGWVGVG